MFDYKSVTYTDENGETQNAYEYLMKDGNLGVPGGNLGGDTVGCAPYAIALFVIYTDATGDDDVNLLDGCMSDVVNSVDGVTYYLLDGAHAIPGFAEDWLTDEHREWADEYAAWAYGE